jgi:hypothetical protein
MDLNIPPIKTNLLKRKLALRHSLCGNNSLIFILFTLNIITPALVAAHTFAP